MDQLSTVTSSHAYPQAPCAITAIKMEGKQKINIEMTKIAHGA